MFKHYFCNSDILKVVSPIFRKVLGSVSIKIYFFFFLEGHKTCRIGQKTKQKTKQTNKTKRKKNKQKKTKTKKNRVGQVSGNTGIFVRPYPADDSFTALRILVEIR